MTEINDMLYVETSLLAVCGLMACGTLANRLFVEADRVNVGSQILDNTESQLRGAVAEVNRSKDEGRGRLR